MRLLAIPFRKPVENEADDSDLTLENFETQHLALMRQDLDTDKEILSVREHGNNRLISDIEKRLLELRNIQNSDCFDEDKHFIELQQQTIPKISEAQYQLSVGLRAQMARLNDRLINSLSS